MVTSLPLLISLGEGVVLLALLVALFRVQRQVRRLGMDPGAALAQMREVLEEIQMLSAALAGQMIDRVQSAEPAMNLVRRPAAERESAGNGPGARAAQARNLALDEAASDREAARVRGMDPLGLALQRSLPRPARPAS